MLVHRQKNKSSPKMISKLKLITALALALHGAAGDDLCAPASTSAARRVYVGRASRAARRVPTQGTAPSSTVGRRDRGADGRADRAGLVRTASKLNDSFKNPIWSKSGAASAAHRLRSGLPVDRTTPRRLAVGPATRGLPAGCPGEPTTTWQHMSSNLEMMLAPSAGSPTMEIIPWLRHRASRASATPRAPRPSSSAAASSPRSTRAASFCRTASGRVLRGAFFL